MTTVVISYVIPRDIPIPGIAGLDAVLETGR